MPPCAKCDEASAAKFELGFEPRVARWYCMVTPARATAPPVWFYGPDPLTALRTAVRATEPRMLGTVPAGHDEICLEVRG